MSILIPAFNAAKYLPQCLDSIVSQTYRDLQIVIIDDGSKDTTWSIMQAYARKDSRIEIYHQENQGVAVTRNALLTHIEGGWFLFVDADDWLESNMIEFLVFQASIGGSEIVTCGNAIDDNPVNKQYSVSSYDQVTAIREFLRHKKLRGTLWNKLIQTNLVHNIRFVCDISYGEDALFCWELFQHINSIRMTDCQLYHYRMNQESISHASFGQKKMSSYTVWKRIVDDVNCNWPQFAELACARFCIEMVLLLRDAAQSGYRYDSSIKLLQEVIWRYGYLITKTRLSSIKMRLYGIAGCISYSLLRLLRG